MSYTTYSRCRRSPYPHKPVQRARSHHPAATSDVHASTGHSCLRRSHTNRSPACAPTPPISDVRCSHVHSCLRRSPHKAVQHASLRLRRSAAQSDVLASTSWRTHCKYAHASLSACVCLGTNMRSPHNYADRLALPASTPGGSEAAGTDDGASTGTQHAGDSSANEPSRARPSSIPLGDADA